jgi:hypothetical protein
MLVVERQRAGPGGGPAQRVEVGVGSDHHVRGDLGGGLVGGGGQHAQRLTEGDCRLMGHPGQLAPADHCHDGRRGGIRRHAAYRVTIPANALTWGAAADSASSRAVT